MGVIIRCSNGHIFCPVKAESSLQSLERNWRLIRDEGLSVMDEARGLFLPEDENLREKGDWSQFTLWQQGELLVSGLFSTASDVWEVGHESGDPSQSQDSPIHRKLPRKPRLSKSIVFLNYM